MLLTKNITRGAVCAGIVVIILGFLYLFPVLNLTLYTLSSLCMAICILITDIRTSVITYLASSFLIFIFYGTFLMFPFLIFFGIYPIIKAILEKKFEKYLAFIIKMIYPVIVIIFTLTILERIVNLSFINIVSFNEITEDLKMLAENSRFVLPLIFLFLVIAFIIYDTVLGYLIFLIKSKKLFHINTGVN